MNSIPLLDAIAEYMEKMDELSIKEKEIAMQKIEAWQILNDKLDWHKRPWD